MLAQVTQKAAAAGEEEEEAATRPQFAHASDAARCSLPPFLAPTSRCLSPSLSLSLLCVGSAALPPAALVYGHRLVGDSRQPMKAETCASREVGRRRKRKKSSKGNKRVGGRKGEQRKNGHNMTGNWQCRTCISLSACPAAV